MMARRSAVSMTTRLCQLLLILAMLSAPAGVYADGFPIKHGRYAGGPVVDITRTKKQADLIRQKSAHGVVIQLTNSQQGQLRSEAKLSVVPTRLAIYHAADLADTCTCFAANLGFVGKAGQIEVPVEYLCSDEEAERRKPDPNG